MLAKLKKAQRILESAGWRGLVDVGARKLGLDGLRFRRRALSMITPQEIAWTEGHIRKHYRGAGQVVDLGCWLGSSTNALARGLAKGGHAAVVHAYDRFIWERWMDEMVGGTRLQGKYQPGDSFLPDFEQQTRRWQLSIEVHAGDLLRQTWSGQPIEFLFIDVMKSWELAGRVLQQFFPCLIPGVSIIQHQDFVHYYTSWIPLLAYRFREYFEPVCHIPGSPSVIFRCKKAITSQAIATGYSFDSFNTDEFEAAYGWAEELVEPAMRDRIRLARIMAFIHQGLIMRAGMELMQEEDENRLADSWDLQRVQEALLR
jgi:hypothetical protein